MSSAQLLTAQQLAARLSEPDLLVLDCRFWPSKTRPTAPASIRKTSSPGASLPISNGTFPPCAQGRDPRSPSAAGSRRAMLKANKPVAYAPGYCGVLYDDGLGAFAARAWWLLHWLGKRDGVYLLDARSAAWKAAGWYLTNGEQSSTRRFPAAPDAPGALLIDATLQPNWANPDWRCSMLCARSRASVAKRAHRSGRRASLVSSAPPSTDNLAAATAASAGTIAPAVLRPVARSPGGRVGVYCGSGVTATTCSP